MAVRRRRLKIPTPITFRPVIPVHARRTSGSIVQGECLSTIDLVGPEFSLIAGSKGRDWERVVADVGEKVGLALQCHVIGDELADVEGTFNERFGIGDTGAVLVRPDGFIAWRMQQLGPNAAADLGNVIARILS